jgi:2-polyprenyl-3-methyl-5-hydroxy-6-metoxy-1,4-benzoquinol methylase
MFKERATQAELMDDLSLTGPALRKNLEELSFINHWLGGYQVVLHALDKLLATPAYEDVFFNRLEVADIGCGGGDILKKVAAWGRQKDVNLKLTGVDANPFMLDYAAGKCASFPEINFRRYDVFSNGFKKQTYDIIICSLFCHHFNNRQLASMLRQLHSQARLAVVINDLHRHPLAYYSIKWLTIAFSRSYLVKNDAPLSVLRAFRRKELENILAEAGIREYSIKWHWAFRWQIIVYK